MTIPKQKTWTEATWELRQRLKVADLMGAGFQFSQEGTMALHGLLTEMAAKLDEAVKQGLAEGPKHG